MYKIPAELNPCAATDTVNKMTTKTSSHPAYDADIAKIDGMIDAENQVKNVLLSKIEILYILKNMIYIGWQKFSERL